jgi:ATP-binding cassette subfamily B (MDR/TAP) protein 1
MEMQAMMGSGHKSKVAYERAGAIQSETVMAVRTVSGLGREQKFIQLYETALDEPYKKEIKATFVRGIGYGFGQAATFGIFGLSFWYGATLVRDDKATIANMFKAIMAVIFGAMGAGQVVSMVPDLDKAKKAASEVFALQDRVPPINAMDNTGKSISKTKGALELDGVLFKYAQRQNQTILKRVDLKIEPGKTVALVGASGCGKSTVIQLLERFYDPDEGSVRIDGKDMKDLNVQDVRKLIGIVQQEPVLFSTTIRANILYGAPDATEEEMLAASKAANLHQFVEALRDKYDTEVGSKGSKLSGGQKQRVAIARALIRNPKILLLDEATSALDTKAERLVQDALDKAREGRTTLVIAHRLSTIQNADLIVAMESGRIKETGTHEELMDKKGVYYRMVMSRAEI